MIHRILDLPFSPKKGGIDDESLQRLLHGHEVVRLREWLYVHEGAPHLVVSIGYRLAALPAPNPRPAPTADTRENHGSKPEPAWVKTTPEGRDPDWRSILSEENMKLFETLRAWRTARARQDAVPPYVILTNIQLAEVANLRPRTLAALRAIPGVGESRIERFGKDVLAVVTTGVVGNGVVTTGAVASGAGPQTVTGPEASGAGLSADAGRPIGAIACETAPQSAPPLLQPSVEVSP
jgi:hypothetical protein